MNDIRDIVTIEFNPGPLVYGTLVEMATPARVGMLINRLDRIMFGKRGSLATSIEREQGRGGSQWPPLAESYLARKGAAMGGFRAFKRALKASGGKYSAKGSARIHVISTKIWIRTGKFLEFCQTIGGGRYKSIRLYPDMLFTGGTFYEVYVDGDPADYWAYVNDGTSKMPQRPIAFFTAEDRQQINKVFVEWVTSLLTMKLAASPGWKANVGQQGGAAA